MHAHTRACTHTRMHTHARTDCKCAMIYCVHCLFIGNLPFISTDPMDVIVTLHHGNEIAVFSCEANGGSNDIQYTWFAKTSDGDMMLEGETSNTLMLSQITVEMNNTQFYCVASNNSGNVTSGSAHLTVTSKLTMYQCYVHCINNLWEILTK